MDGHIFVYGTLKVGQKRQGHWPRRPQVIRPAWTLGRLYDVGPYPALVAGDDRVAGEVWSLRESDLPATFEILDRIEGTNQPGVENDYDRVQQAVTLRDGTMLQASLYRFAKLALLSHFTYLPPEPITGSEAYSLWPTTGEWGSQPELPIPKSLGK